MGLICPPFPTCRWCMLLLATQGWCCPGPVFSHCLYLPNFVLSAVWKSINCWKKNKARFICWKMISICIRGAEGCVCFTVSRYAYRYMWVGFKGMRVTNICSESESSTYFMFQVWASVRSILRGVCAVICWWRDLFYFVFFVSCLMKFLVFISRMMHFVLKNIIFNENGDFIYGNCV